MSWEAFTLRAAKDGEFRDVTGTVWFPRLPDLRDAYARDRVKVLPFVRPPLMQEPWQTEPGHGAYLDAVRANPKKAGEGGGTYIVRIAEIVAGRQLPEPLPRMSREPGEEG